MNKEIKQQIDYSINKNRCLVLPSEYTKILLDYIINLQKENEILKKPLIENWENAQTIKVKNPLQHRIDKAIEYIENADWYLPIWELRDGQPSKTELLNILKGSEEQ